MKKSLLATAAAVALIAGAGFASAAEGPKQQPAAGHAEMNKAPAPKAETTGAGPAEEKAQPNAEMKAEPKAGMKAEPKAGAEAAPKADMKSGTKAEMKPDSKTEMKSENKADPRNTKAETKSDSKDMKSEKADSSKPGADTKAKSAADDKASPNAKSANDTKGDAKGGKAASLTTEQKTKIRTTVIEKGNAPKVSRSSINFNISIGTAVPRSVHFVTVPPTIVEYYPSWRGYDYFVVDEQIIILDPHTLQIVAILDV